ncbi:MAG: YggT family protein [Dehalococcoidia bacterium]
MLLVLTAAIFLRVILSWASLVFPISPTNPLVVALHEITEPILAPLRRVLPRFGMIDLSPMVALFVLLAIREVVARSL